jgi:DNA-binding MarR family transcriptional regulator
MVEQRPLRTAHPVDDFGVVLGLAYQAFVDRLRAALASHGFDDLGGAYGYVFRALADEQLSQRELARRLGITDQGMAKIVAEMVYRGYVERRPDAVDSRVKRLNLAPRGRAALAAARRFHATFERQLESEVGPAPARQLRRILQAIVDRGPADETSRARLRPT